MDFETKRRGGEVAERCAEGFDLQAVEEDEEKLPTKYGCNIRTADLIKMDFQLEILSPKD